ncbi:hypothetical protein Nepgr_024752 [Nepenthes gracilis]|uniref:Uncharacterized protein n=1 Tax=Nepenthes gracilis TaxID=150966 RepID=A0AAD3T5Q1_NEPGR|nr:hypothetical protein Nepgr_024752 [Nepenthes gracilis]
MVWFAPEILSAEAPSSAPHRRMFAPCSDICHPIKFRRSNLGNLASQGVPMDDGPKLASSPFAPPREALGVVPLDDALSSIDILPNPGADIENHDLSIPPSDGMTSEMEPASVIDPDLTFFFVKLRRQREQLHRIAQCQWNDIHNITANKPHHNPTAPYRRDISIQRTIQANPKANHISNPGLHQDQLKLPEHQISPAAIQQRKGTLAPPQFHKAAKASAAILQTKNEHHEATREANVQLNSSALNSLALE